MMKKQTILVSMSAEISTYLCSLCFHSPATQKNAQEHIIPSYSKEFFKVDMYLRYALSLDLPLS